MTDLQNDIEKYLNGELSPSEMHALEKKALDDPFLADALEGAEFLSPEAFHEDMEDLRQQLQARIEPEERKTVQAFWIWTARIAAGLLLITIATFMLNILVTRQSEEEIASLTGMDTSKHSDTLDIYMPPAHERHSGTYFSNASFNVSGNASAAGVSNISSAMGNEHDVEVNLMATESLERILSVDDDNNVSTPAISSDNAKDKPRIAYSYSNAPVGNISSTWADSVAIPSPTPLKARGRILFAEDGSALPGVSITLKGTAQSTISDAEGYFEIPVLTGETSTLRLAYVGMQNQEIKVAPGADVQVQMTSDVAALSEVVVVDRNAERKDVAALEPAVPDGGRQAFNDYIKQNLKYPDQALQNSIEGRVTVEFTVEPSGKISDFKIVKGLGYGCDEEAIRLIKQGPKWIPARRTTSAVGEQVKVRLKFALPRKK